jgi:histidine ammonia-lyase
MSETVTLRPGQVPLATWRKLLRSHTAVALDESAEPAVRRCRQTIDELIATGQALYGVNTGFGKLAQIRIEDDRLAELQRNLVLSHSVGTGPLIHDDVVRLVMIMKAASLGRGVSGIRWEIVDALIKLANVGVCPCMPSKGSVGASGDLAPLAHMAAALMGVGSVRHQGRQMDAADGLALAGLVPFELGPKEGVALINGTQVSTALALKGLFAAEDYLRAALVTGSMTLDACKGSDTPFDARIHDVRGQPGQSATAQVYRDLLKGSAVRESHVDCERVQDPYCLRCQPQVMGACLDHLSFAAQVIGREANAVSDNPLVFPDDKEVLSGGNFHAEPVAMAADVIAIVLAEIGSLSERRQAMLVDSSISGLPAFLAKESGLNSGFMMPQVTSAALVSENKGLAHPASVDSIPTSANQEDHVSMATYAARRLLDMADNVCAILAIEWMSACEGLDFHAPLKTSVPLETAKARLRAEIAPFDRDRFFAPEIEKAKQLISAGALDDLVGEAIGPSQGAE